MRVDAAQAFETLVISLEFTHLY